MVRFYLYQNLKLRMEAGRSNAPEARYEPKPSMRIFYLEDSMEAEIEGHEFFWSKCVEPYKNLKKENPKTILLFRNDVYFEILFDDARIAGEVLGIPVAELMVSDFSKMSIAIFRVEKQGGYIDRLCGEGLKVAICENGERDKNAKETPE